MSGVRLQITCAQITMIHYWCFSWMVFKPASLLLYISEPLKRSITAPDAVRSQLFNRKFNYSLRLLMNSRNKISAHRVKPDDCGDVVFLGFIENMKKRRSRAACSKLITCFKIFFSIIWLHTFFAPIFTHLSV